MYIEVYISSAFSKSYINAMLDAWWDMGPLAYTSYYNRNNKVGLEMLKDLELREPRLFNYLRTRASKV